MACHSVCAYGDGWLQEVVGGERGLWLHGKTPDDCPPTNHPITPLRGMKENERARHGTGKRERNDSGLRVKVMERAH